MHQQLAEGWKLMEWSDQGKRRRIRRREARALDLLQYALVP